MWTYPTVCPDIIFSTQCAAGVVKDVLPIRYVIKISPKACFSSSSLKPFKNIMSFHGISHKKSYCIPHQDNFSEVCKLDFFVDFPCEQAQYVPCSVTGKRFTSCNHFLLPLSPINVKVSSSRWNNFLPPFFANASKRAL